MCQFARKTDIEQIWWFLCEMSVSHQPEMVGRPKSLDGIQVMLGAKTPQEALAVQAALMQPLAQNALLMAAPCTNSPRKLAVTYESCQREDC